MKEGGFLSHLPQKQVVRLGFYPHQWAYPAHTRGSFRFTTKGTKGVPGLCPWTPLGGIISPPAARRCAALPLPPRRTLHGES